MSKASEQPSGHTFPSLVGVMQRLIAPDGCPWDREQTLESLRPYLIEECAEVLDAIDAGSAEDHCEELGDLLMQIVFQAELRSSEAAFDIDAVIAGIRDKLVRRHPHVFADSHAEDSAEVLAQWEKIKAAEKAERGIVRTSAIDGVPSALPGLARAQAISKKAAKVGFDWPDVAGTRAKVDEELGELDEAIAAGDQAAISDELGDVLFAIVSLARRLKCDSELALRDTITKFTKRFHRVEALLVEADRTMTETDIDELDRLWNEVKRER